MHRLIALTLLAACGTEPEPEPAPEAPSFIAPPFAGGPAARPMVPKQARPAAPALQGRVLETLDSGGYTYVRADLCGDETWIAGPPAKLAVGDTIALDGAMPMKDFESTTLGRTFETIVFARAIGTSTAPPDCSVAATPAAPAPSPAAHGPGDGHDHGAPPPTGPRQGKVIETMTGGGYRYARVDFCGTETWIAGPGVPLEVGQTIETGQGATMRDFPSSTLNRSFATIDFVGGMKVVAGPPTCR